MPLLVLGVVRSSHPLPDGSLPGGDGFDVQLISSGELAAAVTEIDDTDELTREDAARHLDALIALLRNGPVLPIAFGTVSPDVDAVREEVLDAAADDLVRRMESVDGYVETRVDVFFEQSVALHDLMRTHPDIQALAAEAKEKPSGLDGRISLGEAVASELPQWRLQRAEALLPSLTGPVEAVTELDTEDPLRQRWAFLVAEGRLGELDIVVGLLRSSLGTEASVEYTGPLPVYSFLGPQVQEEAAESPSRWGW